MKTRQWRLSARQIRWSLVGWLGVAMLVQLPIASAQKEMTAEELAAYIAEQKAALEEVEKNRKQTEAQIDKVQARLDKQAEKREQLRAEVESLCEEQETLEPGSYEECVESFAN